MSITAAVITERERRGLLWHRHLDLGAGFFMYEGTHFFDTVTWLMASEIETSYAVGLGTCLREGSGQDSRGHVAGVETGLVEHVDPFLQVLQLVFGLSGIEQRTGRFLDLGLRGRPPLRRTSRDPPARMVSYFCWVLEG